MINFSRLANRRWTRATVAIALSVGIAMIVSSCGSDGTPKGGSSGKSGAGKDVSEEATAAPVDLGLRKVGVELDNPIAATPGLRDNSLIVAERNGTVREVTFDRSASGPSKQAGGAKQAGDAKQPIEATLSDPIIDISDETGTESERGLLGVAVSRDAGRLFISYTAAGDGTSKLDAYDLSSPVGEDLAVDTKSRTNLLSVAQPFPNHNGGNIAIGPDGMLYLGLGDGGAGGDPYGNAQNRGSLLGKILRLNPKAKGPGDVSASGNPFADTKGAKDEIWLTGVRNPWRFSFDATTGDLWIGDVGQDTWEEVDLLPKSSGLGKGANLGWDLFEGTERFADANPAPGAASKGPFVEPVYTYRHGPGCSITGGVVYRGQQIPSLVGTYLFSDFCDPTIRGLVPAVSGKDSGFHPVDFNIKSSQVAGFATDSGGETYVLSLDKGLFRIVSADTVSG